MAITYGGRPQQMGGNPLVHGYGQPRAVRPPPRPIEANGRPQQMGGNPLVHGYGKPPPRVPLRPPGSPPGSVKPGAPGQSVPGPVVYPSPLDAQYFQALKDATFNAYNNIGATNLRSAYARIDLQNQLDQLAHQQPLDTLREQEAENARGGFAQGHLGQQIGELNRSYLDRESTAQTNFGRQQAARDAAVAAIKGGLSLQQAALAAAAADRASVAAQRNPAVGGPGGPSLTGGSTPATSPGKTPGTAKPPTGPPLLSKSSALNTFRPLQTRVVNAAKHASSAFTIPTPKPPRSPNRFKSQPKRTPKPTPKNVPKPRPGIGRY